MVVKRHGLTSSVNALTRPSLERGSSESLGHMPVTMEPTHSQQFSSEAFPGFSGELLGPCSCVRRPWGDSWRAACHFFFVATH